MIQIEMFVNDDNVLDIKSADDVTRDKTLNCTDMEDACKKVSDIVTWGDPSMFKLICKASSAREGWMRSTKAMEVGFHVIVQVSTYQRNASGEVAIAEALTTVESARICEQKDESGRVINRWIEAR